VAGGDVDVVEVGVGVERGGDVGVARHVQGASWAIAPPTLWPRRRGPGRAVLRRLATMIRPRGWWGTASGWWGRTGHGRGSGTAMPPLVDRRGRRIGDGPDDRMPYVARGSASWMARPRDAGRGLSKDVRRQDRSLALLDRPSVARAGTASAAAAPRSTSAVVVCAQDDGRAGSRIG
jgi:hypothetical protein